MTPNTSRTLVGHVAGLQRYPVKSMQGESLQQVSVGPDGLYGDRQFAVIDTETGRVASAKNPRKWAGLLELRAEWREGVLIVTALDSTAFRSDRDDLSAKLSRLLGRTITLRGTPLASDAIEIHWPDIPGLPNAGSESVEGLPTGSYFDLAPIHLLTTSALKRFRELTTGCDFDPRRFRPNIVIETLPALTGFVENHWLGRSVVIGEARLQVTSPCSRCVMTTLSQPGLSADPKVLRAAVTHNASSAGVYASTSSGGDIAVGAPVWLA